MNFELGDCRISNLEFIIHNSKLHLQQFLFFLTRLRVEALEGLDVYYAVGEEYAIEVVYLVLEDAGEIIVGLEAHFLPLRRLGFHSD